MANKMLIDAAHPEETRVVVLRGSRVEEFDFEAANRKQLRGNIYLAKVTRVEPSLQAAFVEYGGNRHGFLAFSEIHPDYYQIPVSDRQALIEAEAQEEPEEEERKPRRSRRHRRERPASSATSRQDESVSEPAPEEEDSRPVTLDATSTPPYDDPTPAMIEHAQAVREDLQHEDATGGSVAETSAVAETPAVATPPLEVLEPAVDEPAPGAPPAPMGTSGLAPTAAPALSLTAPAEGTAHEVIEPAVDEPPMPASAPDAEEIEPAAREMAPIVSDAQVDTGSSEAGSFEPLSSEAAAPRGREHPEEGEDGADGHDDEEDVSEHVEQLGGDAMEEIPTRAYRSRKQYKIQEVIKRRQVLLVQVVKEERGNKGAALTTYLSLAGRYSVLMPNTAKGGGISRKITDAGDRQRLKSIAQELEVPDGMGIILRTAGASRTKPEVKRDYEYLMRMWETVRETTMQSQAPTLVYEEGSLIKRSIRDLYNKDVEEVIVAGEAGYREAKDFMRLLMPSHARNVQPWRDPQPIFAKAGAEAQLDAMFSAHVTLKSGGYLVINQTEALVAIDVNSGRSTREHNIEDTALRTNLEAADEVARQLRLRDLAGLIVVDFIDMEENRNNRAVEKRIKDALKNDRARIQVGRISHFGLLEMSRQRIRTGVLEGSTVVCEHCAGAGMVRSTSSIALHVLRLLEDALISDRSFDIVVRARSAVALYILNQKRAHLGELEARFGVCVTFAADEALTGTTYCAVERGEPSTGIPQPSRLIPKYEFEAAEDDAVIEAEDDAEEEAEAVDAAPAEARDGQDGEGSRRKRRRRRRGRDRESSGIADDAPQPADDALGFAADVASRTERLDGESMDSGSETAGGDGVGLDEEAAETVSDRPGGREGRRRRSRRGGRRPREEGGERHESVAGGDTDVAAEASERDESAAPLAASVEPEDRSFGSMETLHAVEGSDTVGDAPVTEVALANALVDGVAARPAPAPTEAARAAPVPPDAEAPSAEMPAFEAPASETSASETPASVTKKPELISSVADPAQPKRSGWWQRAKATLGG